MQAERIPRLARDERLARHAGVWWGLAEGPSLTECRCQHAQGVRLTLHERGFGSEEGSRDCAIHLAAFDRRRARLAGLLEKHPERILSPRARPRGRSTGPAIEGINQAVRKDHLQVKPTAPGARRGSDPNYGGGVVAQVGTGTHGPVGLNGDFIAPEGGLVAGYRMEVVVPLTLQEQAGREHHEGQSQAPGYVRPPIGRQRSTLARSVTAAASVRTFA